MDPMIKVAVAPIFSRTPERQMERILKSLPDYKGPAADFLAGFISSILYKLWIQRNAWMYDDLKPSIRDTVHEVAAELIRQAEGHYFLIFKCNGSDNRKHWYHENFIQTHIAHFDENEQITFPTAS